MRQFYGNEVRKKKYDEHLKETPPSPLIRKNLIENSIATEFEEARREWEYGGRIPNDSEGYVENCELCNSHLYVENHLIENSNTKTKLRIGSDCIKRFIILNGMETQADSVAFFEIKEKEYKKEIELRVLYKEVIEGLAPLARHANRFRTLLLDLLEKKGQTSMLKTREEQKKVISQLFKIEHRNSSHKEYIQFDNLMNDPSTFVVTRENKRYKAVTYKEGDTFRKRGKVTGSTLSSSSAYRVEKY